jgi:hypothetical protein
MAFEEAEARHQAVRLVRMNPDLSKLLLHLHSAGMGWRAILSRLRESLPDNERSIDENQIPGQR